MEKTFYKSYKELVSEYFGIDYQVGENTPKLSKQLSKKGIVYTEKELQAFSELLLAVFSDSKELVSIATVYSQLMAIILRYRVFGSVLMIVLVRNVFGQNGIKSIF